MQRIWYSGSWWHLTLLPLSLLFIAATAMRRFCYARGWLRRYRLPVPVVVVGNLTVGGTGKTPVTVWLARQLKERGFRPGIVSRGYGGVVGDTPMQASAGSDPDIVGDEPILIATRSRCPVIVHPDRLAAARELLAMEVDVVISDDGLQHYRLEREYEIAVIDGARAFGNGHRLPAGPLREPVSRLRTVDCALIQQAAGSDAGAPTLSSMAAKSSSFHLVAHELHGIESGDIIGLDALRGRTVHAVAAIGNPQRFFHLLESHGLRIVRHALPDHATISPADIAFADEHDVVMTEKDAVKCRAFASARHWCVPVTVDMHDASWLDDLERRLREPARQAAR